MPSLLIITQSADPDDQLLGFFGGWIREFEKHFSPVGVVALRTPQKNWWRLIGQIFWEVPKYDVVFCHMAPIFVIIAAPWAHLWRKRVVFWYAHKSVTFKLRVATKLAHKIFTSTPEGFRLASSKVVVVGQGIDMEKFKPADKKPEPFSILTVSRISPIKNLETILATLLFLPQAKLTIIGEPGSSQDNAYLDSLVEFVEKNNLKSRVHFLGKISHNNLPVYYQSHNIFINTSGTGSLDKTIVEAMASGCTVVSSNDAARAFLPKDLIITDNNPEHIAEIIKSVATKNFPELRDYVIKHHSLDALIEKIYGH